MKLRGWRYQRAMLALLLAALASAASPAWALSEAQDLAARLGWFLGRSRFLLEANRRDPSSDLVAALNARMDLLLPPGALEPDQLGAEQRSRQLAAAQELGSSAATRRELQCAASRQPLAPRLRAAAAMALAVLRHELAPASLAMALVDQEDRAAQQLMIHELLDALPRFESRPDSTPDDRQLFFTCRRIAALSGCEESPLWQKHEQLASELRQLESAGEQTRAAQLVSAAPLPSACLSRFLAALAALPGPDSGDRVWRAVLQRSSERLVYALQRNEAPPNPEARQVMEKMLSDGLGRLTDRRALASAANQAVLLDARGLIPALQDLAQRVQQQPLLRLIRTNLARLQGEPLPLDALP